jgi:hypothetical protein
MRIAAPVGRFSGRAHGANAIPATGETVAFVYNHGLTTPTNDMRFLRLSGEHFADRAFSAAGSSSRSAVSRE